MVTHVFAEDRSVAGARQRRVWTTVAASIAIGTFILLFCAWARSVSTVDNVLIPAGSFTRFEAASGNGRLVFVVERSKTPGYAKFHFQSRLGYPGGDAAVLLRQSRSLYYTYFGRDTLGFIWVLDHYGLAIAIPYWFPVSLAALTCAWFTRLWFLRRRGRIW